MFVDSVAGSTATASGAISSEDSVGTYIGRFGTTYYNGGIQDVTFYTSVPSDELRTHEYAQTSDNAAFWGTWAWESAGGNTYSVECSDGINLTDSISSSSIISAILSDGMIASDSPASSISMNISISDSVALNDAVSTFSQIQAIMSELATFTDSATTEKPPIEVLCSDSITLTDSTESSIIMQVVCPEGIVLSDFAQAVAIIASSCSDGVTLTDVFIDSTFLPQGIVTITGYSAKLKITFNVVSKLNITYEEIGKPTIIGGNA